MIHLDASLVTAVEELQALIAEETAAVEKATAAPTESTLSVREVQARLRRGRTIEQVAKEAGVDASWVSRFAVPVLAEQAEVVRAARATKMIKQRVIVSGANLGDAVYRNLADRGITDPRDRLDKNWSARQLTEGAWLVTFKYTLRGRVSEAAWEYDSATGALKARGRLGTQLGFREPRRPPRPPAAAATKKSQPAKKAAKPSRKATARNSKRVAAARTAATARMVSHAERSTKRNAALARNAAKKTIGIPRVRFEPLPPLPQRDPEPLLADDDQTEPAGWADELDLAWEGDTDVETEPEADEVEEVDEEVDEELEVADDDLEEEPLAPRRAPLRARRVPEPDDVPRRIRLRPSSGEAEAGAGNGPVFRGDLARPAVEHAGYPRPLPSDPLSIPVPIDRPPRRRRRPLRGR